MSFDHFVSIHGVPRSGTSWLGQIFNSHSRVAYRFQPLFSYRFRDRLSLSSTAEEILAFLNELYQVTDDDFIAGNWPRQEKNEPPSAPTLRKQNRPDVMVMKEVRYHYMIEKFIQAVPDIKVIGIVRNPCAVINSWLHNPNEFSPEWDTLSEWRRAPTKNQAKASEYFGYEKWKELTASFLHLEQCYPGTFALVRYEQLVSKPVETIERAFSFAGLDVEAQVTDFIHASQSRHLDDPYAVYKSPGVKDKWREQLDFRIVQAIAQDLSGTKLESFLE